MSEIVECIKKQLATSEDSISDGKQVMSYRECGKRVADDAKNRKSSFNALVLRNKLPEALQVISHLVNQRNFLVLNGSTEIPRTKESLTNFCQNIVTCETDDTPGHQAAFALPVVEKNLFFKPGSGFSDDQKSYLVLRTSGTTNQPKFVLHDQQSVLRNSRRVAERLGLGTGDRVLIPVSIHHSYGLVTAFTPALIAGCSIRLISHTNLIRLIEAINSFKPTVLFATPGLVEMLLRVKTSIRIPKVTLTAGDKIREDLFVKYEKQTGTLLNLYGSTEMGAMAVSDGNQALDRRARGGVVALPGVEFKATGSDAQLGTILCKNDSGFVQYLNCEAERVETPQHEDGWFDTKDLGRSDGSEIMVLGRSDHKINRNGVLVSYFELETAIESACDELKKVIVVKLPGQNIIGAQFAAVCELKENCTVGENQIRKKCTETLSRSMVPDAIEIVGAMPLLPNGKIDRNFLQKRFL